MTQMRHNTQANSEPICLLASICSCRSAAEPRNRRAGPGQWEGHGGMPALWQRRGDAATAGLGWPQWA